MRRRAPAPLAYWQSSRGVQDGEPNSSGDVLFHKYLLQRPQRGGERLWRDYSQFLPQPGLVHGANLVEQDQTLPATMIDTDPKRDAPVLNGFRVSVGHRPLHFDSAPHRIYNTGELCEHSIARVLYDTPSMLLDLRINEIAEVPSQAFMCAFLIRTH